MKTIVKAALFILALAANGSAWAEKVAMVLESTGTITAESAGRNVPIGIATTFSPGTRVSVGTGGFLSFAFYPTRETFSATGPALLIIEASGVSQLQGSALKNAKAPENLAVTTQGFQDRAVPGALVMRSAPPPARISRHALIIGISHYANPANPPLPGVKIDKESATQMAQAMQVPVENIRYLHDEQATGDGLRSALQELADKVEDGDRVFIHYSGHGTRYYDKVAGGCVEALLAYDGGASGTVTNREMAQMLKEITDKTDKLFVMYDACHSGGLVQATKTLASRGVPSQSSEGKLVPKFVETSEVCSKPTNVKTRNLVVEATSIGAQPQDIIQISASRDNEISFDDAQRGGLATQYMRDCMLGEARDLDGSGAITVDEIKECAQAKIDRRMGSDDSFKPHHITLNGNLNFVPAWFGHASANLAVPVSAAVPPTVALAIPAKPPTVPSSSATPAKPTSAPAPAAIAGQPPKPSAAATPISTTASMPATMPISTSSPAAALPIAVIPNQIANAAASFPPRTGDQALRDVMQQSDAKRKVVVVPSATSLKIGQDSLNFSVQSDRAGYVYVALAGSDNESLYILFPNELDRDNKIEAGQTLTLPRKTWRVKAAGPAGQDSVLVLVTDGPRDLMGLSAAKAGPFVYSLNDKDGRAQFGALMTTSRVGDTQQCGTTAQRKPNALCSDAYGASIFTVSEKK